MQTTQQTEAWLKDNGFIEYVNDESIPKSKRFACYVLWFTDEQKVWIANSRSIQSVITRYKAIINGQNKAAVSWPASVAMHIKPGVKVRLFVDLKNYINMDVHYYFGSQRMVLPKAAKRKEGACNSWIIRLNETPWYRLVISHTGVDPEQLMRNFLVYARNQSTATHKSRDMKFRNWCVEHRESLNHRDRFTIEPIATHVDADAANEYLREYANQMGSQFNLTIKNMKR